MLLVAWLGLAFGGVWSLFVMAAGFVLLLRSRETDRQWWLPGIVFGLALSVASTVVLLRALEARNLVDTENGRIAIGWLVVEDLAMVLVLVLLPVRAFRTADCVYGWVVRLVKLIRTTAMLLATGEAAVADGAVAAGGATKRPPSSSQAGSHAAG